MIDCSQLSKLIAFLSRLMHRIRQCGTIFQIAALRCQPKLPCHEDSRSITLSVITQWIPNKQTTKDLISEAIGKCLQMIHIFPIPFTHDALINHADTSLP